MSLAHEAISSLTNPTCTEPGLELLWETYPGFMAQPAKFRISYNPMGVDLHPLQWWTTMRSWPRTTLVTLKYILRRKLERRTHTEIQEVDRVDAAVRALEKRLEEGQSCPPRASPWLTLGSAVERSFSR